MQRQSRLTGASAAVPPAVLQSSPHKPLPITQIRKTKPEVAAEIAALLEPYCDLEI